MYAIRIVGVAWYQFHDSFKCMTGEDLQKATVYTTREEAERTALLVAVKFPQWIGKLRIKKLKKVRAHKVMSVQEPLQVWMEEVDHLVAV